MSRREVFWTVIYYIIVIAASWYLTYDGPPLRTVAYYRVAKLCQGVARTFGSVGLAAEQAYYDELEITHG